MARLPILALSLFAHGLAHRRRYADEWDKYEHTLPSPFGHSKHPEQNRRNKLNLRRRKAQKARRKAAARARRVTVESRR